jgi:hypothetical protein
MQGNTINTTSICCVTVQHSQRKYVRHVEDIYASAMSVENVMGSFPHPLPRQTKTSNSAAFYRPTRVPASGVLLRVWSNDASGLSDIQRHLSEAQ